VTSRALTTHPPNTRTQADRLFHEIACRSYCWRRRELQVEELRKTSKPMLLALYDAYVMPAAQQRRKLTAFVLGQAALDKGLCPTPTPAAGDHVITRSAACKPISLEEALAPEAEEDKGGGCHGGVLGWREEGGGGGGRRRTGGTGAVGGVRGGS
jgi:hypothetical protein